VYAVETFRKEAAMQWGTRRQEEEAMPVQAVTPPVPGVDPSPPIPAAEASHKFEALLKDLDKGEAFLDRVIQRAKRGKDFTPEELISIQAGVYRHTQAMEAFSKLVDSVTGSVRRTLEVGG
jgi:hypothetical protein